MRKSIEELRKLNTKNLLRYYKAERKRFYGGYWCGCRCGELIWEARTSQAEMEQKYADMKQKYNEHKDYLSLIKTELDTREHVS